MSGAWALFAILALLGGGLIIIARLATRAARERELDAQLDAIDKAQEAERAANASADPRGDLLRDWRR